jgi:hypothetical protein
MFRTLICVLAVALASGDVLSQSSTTAFKGRPSVKVSEGGLERTPEQIARDRAVSLECVISQIGGSFYWASRENVELTRVDSGAFLTFVALNGSGYVRVVKPETKSAASLMSPTEERFDYVEHLVIGLRSVTYYGSRQ